MSETDIPALLEKIAALPQVTAVVLAGSRRGPFSDERSAAYGGNHSKNTNPSIFKLSARPDRAATGAELAAVLFDQRGVAAFLAYFADNSLDAG